ncbi:hypothetical protein IMG5_172430 [Ichthyophthirius multifiliis]|uniref:UBA domain-containing protein n=1 Tax=Ichthyophthirius multifiliis TaxID=5932 RepID=G0R1R9_ICHMU|nr:hypothetical protein IMG5_172430 [Ichthyophthirius multifiliis]EGR28571.1 hypothetical protein IMG5_172430 [Ichthyophthirius multifiliis]|eukprot:XP_004029807.1 hypothetical protein IMG5_172430 [Ichthyophthirius multifiliis]
MKITIITEKDQVKEIDFDATAKIEDVKVVLEIEKIINYCKTTVRIMIWFVYVKKGQLSENLANIFKNVTSNSQNSFYLTEAQKQQLESDPFNPENQKKIQEIIEQQQIDQNLEMAQEYMPEVFGKITMLYIDICINDRQVQAFVDTGAESTIISKQCAERCGIMRLVDKRFSGIASGVGTGKILGRIHSYHIQILDQKIPCSFTVIETINLDFLLGLDTLRRFQCLVDLGKNCLTFSLQNRKLDVPFLYEADIKKSVSMELEKQLFEEEDKRNQLNNQNNIKNQNQQQIPQQQQKYQQIQQQPQKQQQQQHQQQQQFSQFPEASIQQLINIGATRQEAIKALTLAHGNLEYAASYIYNQKYGFQE